MLVGLSRILDLIRVNPHDSLLVDRFLILASDLHEDDRADVTLSLSEALLRKSPRRAVELAHMVYKVRPFETEPIELMVEGLENLGRYGKATVLRQHLEKVKRAKETNPGEVQKAVEDSVAAIDRELLLLAQPSSSPEPENPRDAKRQTPPKKAKQTPAIPVTKIDSEDMKSLIVGRKRSETKPPVISDSVVEGGATGLPEDSKSSLSLEVPELQIGLAPGEFEAIRESKTSMVDTGPSYRKLLEDRTQFDHEPQAERAPGVPDYRSNQPTHEGIPSLAANRDEGHIESHKPTTHEAEAARVMPLVFDLPPPDPGLKRQEDLTRAAFSARIEPSLDQVLAEFASLRDQKDWAGLWQLIENHWRGGGTGEVVEMARTVRLYQLDLRFAGWWLDTLMRDRRPREALALGLRIIQQDPHMSVARALFPRLEKCLRLLGHGSTQWVESDGVLALLRKLKDESRGLSAPIVILNGSRSA